jgi:hypothetical protein
MKYCYISRSKKRAGKKSKREDWGKTEAPKHFLSIKLYKTKIMLEEEKKKLS